MSQRRLDNFLLRYLDYTSQHEGPERYHLWTALVLLASAINRRVWVDWGYYKSFPNLYVLFVGPSGIGKSSAAGIGMELLQEAGVNINIFKDSISNAALLQFMSERPIQVKVSETLIEGHTPVTIYASELGNLLNQRTNIRELTLILTELFNKQGDHEDRTNARGEITIAKPCLTFLGCCFPQWIKEELPSSAARSGFLGRMLVVNEKAKRHHRPLPVLSTEELLLRDDLISDLSYIASFHGEMTMTKEAAKWWKTWYETLPLDLSTLDCEIEGFHARKANFVQRVAMLYSMSYSDDKVITKADFKFALSLVDICERDVNAVVEYGQRPKAMDHNERILRMIHKHGEVSRRKLTTSTSRYMTNKERVEALKDLIEGGQIRIIKGKEDLYAYVEEDK